MVTPRICWKRRFFPIATMLCRDVFMLHSMLGQVKEYIAGKDLLYLHRKESGHFNRRSWTSVDLPEAYLYHVRAEFLSENRRWPPALHVNAVSVYIRNGDSPHTSAHGVGDARAQAGRSTENKRSRCNVFTDWIGIAQLKLLSYLIVVLFILIG